MKDVGSLLLVLKLDDDFDGDIDICRMTSNTTFESNDEKAIPNSLGRNKSSLRAVNSQNVHFTYEVATDLS